MKIRLLELCAGYGSQALALKNLGIDVYSEIAEFDKYASQAYMQLHGETKNYGDIYKIDETKLPYFDMITYSTPCQDFSVAGKGKGGDKGSGTRSSLLWECERIIRAVKPKYLLMENVKNLLSKKHCHNFNAWIKVLENMGYTNYYKVLNAKDYGIPQNRERIFCVSILGGGQYLFPNPIPLEKRLKDMLEPTVAEKFYLSLKQIAKFIKSCFHQERDRLQEKDYCDTILSRDYKDPKLVKEPICAASRGRGDVKTEQHLEINYSGCTNTLTSVQKDNYVVEPKVIQVGNIVDSGNWDNPQRGRVYSSDGCSPALNTCQGGGLEPKIIEEKPILVGGVGEINFGKQYRQGNRIYDSNGIAMCLTSQPVGNAGGNSYLYKIEENNIINYCIRKLTPRECWRLMGVKDEQFDRLHDLSNSQLYKLAGNSIVVDVLEHIFRNLLMPETTETKGQLNLF
jgi:DNA (cytosine-5)-methyltransferase 1